MNKCLLLTFLIISTFKIFAENIPQTILTKLNKWQNYRETSKVLIVNVKKQEATLYINGTGKTTYPVSTSVYGTGSKAGSNKTPLGTHKVCKKIGANAPIGTIFKSGINTKKKARIITEPVDVKDDMVTTRILWLRGLEPGKNQGRGIDSEARRIYIHGTPEEGLIGKPASHGCIRMKNEDVVSLFNKMPEGTLVEIINH